MRPLTLTTGYEGVELAKTVNELRAERQTLDEECRSASDQLLTAQQSLRDLSDAQQRISVLESQLANTTSQARYGRFSFFGSRGIK